MVLRAENESLKNENFRLQAAIQNVVCPNCGGQAILGEMSFDEQQLRIENARLKDEVLNPSSSKSTSLTSSRNNITCMRRRRKLEF